MLRIDPAHPPVWRTATRLQFGRDAVVVLDHPKPWQERLVRDLEHGVPEHAYEEIALASGGTSAMAQAFLKTLRPALLPTAGPLPRSPVAVHIPDGFPRAQAEAFLAALEASGRCFVSTRWFGTYDEVPTLGVPVVLLAHHVVQPQRAAALVSGDVPHLPVVLAPDRVEVGPFVEPGSTACLACVDAHRCDADPAWPQIAAQLIGRTAHGVGAALLSEAGLVAARLISDADRMPTTGRSLLIRDDSLQRRWRAHRPHAACRCRSLARTETVRALAAPTPSSTTATAIAQRA